MLAGVAILLSLMLWRFGSTSSGEKTEIVVYCAAGIRAPVAEAAREFEASHDILIRLDHGSSGELEGKLELERTHQTPRCDLYIPADFSFAKRARAKGLTAEQLTVASFQLVLAAHPGQRLPESSIEKLDFSQIDYGICDEKAGAGQQTKDTFELMGLWTRLKEDARATFPRVTELAGAIQSSDVIQAGFIWDSTARQFGLRILPIPELDGAVSRISANVTTQSRFPTWALRFARYLAAPEKGGRLFEKHHYRAAGGDPWSLKPEVTFYCGGVNREAVGPVIKSFEEREGCIIHTQYAGCGTLVGTIQSGQQNLPDLFMTCDVSYLSMVASNFQQPTDVSSTRICMLVRAGNPKGIQRLEDLIQPGLKIGTTDPSMSTLGALSHTLFDEVGIKQTLATQQNIVVTTPTAHELILQMQGHDKLDVALVYEANCQHLSGELESVLVEHPMALATQNMAPARTTPYPHLLKRLMSQILSDQSKDSFLHQGFRWLGDPQAIP